MLGILLLLLWLLAKRTPKTKTRVLSLIYAAFIYSSVVVFFDHQLGVSWNLGNLLLPFFDLTAGLIAGGAGLLIGGLVLLFLYFFDTKRMQKTYTFTRRNWFSFVFSAVLIFSGALAYTSSRWVMKGIGNMRFDQIVFAMTQPLKGSDPGQIQAFIVQPLLEAVLWSTPAITLIYLLMTCSFELKFLRNSRRQPLHARFALMMGVLGLFSGASLSAKVIGYADIKAYYFENTEIYEQYYVDPKTVELKFPKKKRNLVYIFLESMESSYLSTDLGGSQPHNLLPNLAELAQGAGINFSNTDQLGGMLQVPGANQTASSMVAQTSGLPLRPSASLELLDGSGKNSAEYFPGAYSIGEILNQEGYKQTLLIGSKAEFAGRDKYFQKG